MGTYFLKRILLIIPSALLVVLLVFLLYDQAYTDVDVEDLSHSGAGYLTSTQVEELNCALRKSQHLDWPLFYFSLHPLSQSNKIQEVCNPYFRQLIQKLAWHHGNPEKAIELVVVLQKLRINGSKEGTDILEDLLKSAEISQIEANFLKLGVHENEIQEKFSSYLERSSPWHSFIPIVSWSGSKNRFHQWLMGAITLDFGYSVLDRQPVSKKVNAAMKNTLLFTLPAVLLIFVLSIVLAYLMNLRFKRALSNLLYFIDTIPLFWLSIVLILLFSSIPGLSWSFVSAITYTPQEGDGLTNLFYEIPRHFLPILALTLASIPSVTRQIESTFTEIKEKPYIETAVAKGLNAKQLFKGHIFRNALIPISTLFFSFLGFAFGGAFVVEMVFSINGIGKLMADAVLANDLQVISAITLYLVVIKMVVTLLNDIAAYNIDPSLKF